MVSDSSCGSLRDIGRALPQKGGLLPAPHSEDAEWPELDLHDSGQLPGFQATCTRHSVQRVGLLFAVTKRNIPSSYFGKKENKGCSVCSGNRAQD